MIAEDLVITQEQASELRMLGLKQESYFYWKPGFIEGKFVLVDKENHNIGAACPSAFTLTEIINIVRDTEHEEAFSLRLFFKDYTPYNVCKWLIRAIKIDTDYIEILNEKL